MHRCENAVAKSILNFHFISKVCLTALSCFVAGLRWSSPCCWTSFQFKMDFLAGLPIKVIFSPVPTVDQSIDSVLHRLQQASRHKTDSICQLSVTNSCCAWCFCVTVNYIVIGKPTCSIVT